MNLACAHCHEQNWGKRLGAETLSQGQPNGYPAYRLEWQKIGSLERRIRACMFGLHAELPPYGSDAMLELELFLAWRANGCRSKRPPCGARMASMRAMLIGMAGVILGAACGSTIAQDYRADRSVSWSDFLPAVPPTFWRAPWPEDERSVGTTGPGRQSPEQRRHRRFERGLPAPLRTATRCS